MGKRSGLLRVGARPHGPGDAGGANKTKSKIKKKKPKTKNKIKIKAAAVKTTVASAGTDDMFALALPVAAEPHKIKKRDRDAEMADDVDRPAAFEDEGKSALMRKILESARSAAPENLIGADAHRARMSELKRRKADRAAKRAERFAAHQKC